MTNSAIDAAIADVAGGVTKVDQDKLKAVSALAQRQLKLEAEVKSLEEQLEVKRGDLKACSEHDLPNAMIEAGMKSFTLTDGSKVEVQKVYAASIKIENKPRAFNWLREKGHDALIKTEVSLDVGKGEIELAEKVVAWLNKKLEKQGLTANIDMSVHWQTLRAFVREQIETEERLIAEGRSEEAKMIAIPRDLLGVYIIDKAKVTPKKD